MLPDTSRRRPEQTVRSAQPQEPRVRQTNTSRQAPNEQRQTASDADRETNQEDPNPEDLPERILKKRRRLRRATLYKKLKSKYLLPDFNSNACTFQRLTRLAEDKGAGVSANKIPKLKPKFVVGVGVLHKILRSYFAKTVKKNLFHYDAVANYSYYVNALYCVKRETYRKIFKDELPKKSTIKLSSVALQGPEPVFGRNLRTVSRSEAHFSGPRVAQELDSILNVRRLERSAGVPKDSIRLVKQYWTSIRELVKIDASEKQLEKEVRNLQVGLNDPELTQGTKTLAEQIFNEQIVADIKTYIKSKGAATSPDDYNILFKRTVQISSRRPDRGDFPRMPDNLAHDYFSNFQKKELERSRNFIRLFLGDETLSNDQSLVTELMTTFLAKIKTAYSSRLVNLHFYAIGRNMDGTLMFAGSLAQEALPGSSRENFFKKSHYDFYRNEHFAKYSKDNIYTNITRLYSEKLLNCNLMTLAEQHMNIICLQALLHYDPLQTESNADIDIFCRALPDNKGNFEPNHSLNLVLGMLAKEVPALTNLRNQVRIADLGSLVQILENPSEREISKLKKTHTRIVSFFDFVIGHGFAHAIALASASYYPKKTVVTVMKENKDFLKHYLNAVMFVSFYRSGGHSGHLIKLVFVYLRKTNYCDSYFTAVIQIANFFSLGEISEDRKKQLYYLIQNISARPHQGNDVLDPINFIIASEDKRKENFIGNDYVSDTRAYEEKIRALRQAQRERRQAGPEQPAQGGILSTVRSWGTYTTGIFRNIFG